jgi:hypothetical protein
MWLPLGFGATISITGVPNYFWFHSAWDSRRLFNFGNDDWDSKGTVEFLCVHHSVRLNNSSEGGCTRHRRAVGVSGDSGF